MTDDIVTQLREHHCFDDAGCNTMAEDCLDEIERLRAALVECEATISRLKMAVRGD